jgi:DNA-binding transcriptional regulator LsrR (DeoR family)
MEDRDLLVKVAEMYYMDELKQADISKKLNIHRSTISRMLKQAREEKIVEIKINYSGSESLLMEKQLKQLFPAVNITIVPTTSETSQEQRFDLCGIHAAKIFLEKLTDYSSVGISWGHTMASFAKEIAHTETNNVTVIPMIGGPSGKLSSEYHVNTIVHEIAKKINGRAMMIDSPAIVDSKELQCALMQLPYNQELKFLWGKLDIAIFGIGSPEIQDETRGSQFYGANANFISPNTVGDIVSHLFDKLGNPLESPLDDRIIGITLSELKQVPIRIGIADGDNKAWSIIGALRGEYLTDLVTTQKTAQRILEIFATSENTQ